MAQKLEILKEDYRKEIIDEILGGENIKRKAQSIYRSEVYKSNLKEFLKLALKNEYSEKTEKSMRKISSINPAKKIVNEMASIYKTEPMRDFTGASEKQKEQLDKIYKDGEFNIKFKRANKKFKYQTQCTLHPMLCDGKIVLRVYEPHQYDVIPMEDDPERAFAYIINTLDKRDAGLSSGGDGTDQKIADKDDQAKRSKMRFVWWTDELNFVTDGNGKYIIEPGDPALVQDAKHELARLPFVDIYSEKDNDFWSTEGSTIIEFALEFAMMLSDTATINRNQGFSQAVFSSKDKPEEMLIGPMRTLWIPQDPDPETKDPKFEFVSPSPDLASSIELLKTMVKFWLSCQNVQASTVSADGDTKQFNSALERLLAMLERFEASKDDMDIFYRAECEVFEIVRALVNFADSSDLLDEEYQGKLSDEVKMEVVFAEPTMVQTKAEEEDSCLKLQKAGVYDDVDVVMKLESVDEDEAIKRIIERAVRKAKIAAEVSKILAAAGLEAPPEPDQQDPDNQNPGNEKAA